MLAHAVFDPIFEPLSRASGDATEENHKNPPWFRLRICLHRRRSLTRHQPLPSWLLANASDALRWARSELTSCSSPWEDFPPTAVLGAMVMKQGRIGQSHELIIAVDAQRTRNVGELESRSAEPNQ
jgi:hypothetical protein